MNNSGDGPKWRRAIPRATARHKYLSEDRLPEYYDFQPRFPTHIKPEELDPTDNRLGRINAEYVDLSWPDHKWSPNPKRSYNWIVTLNYSLVVGREVEQQTRLRLTNQHGVVRGEAVISKLLGHPTLAPEYNEQGQIIGYGAIRMAGELFYGKYWHPILTCNADTWNINNFSGRFSPRLPAQDVIRQLLRVRDMFKQFADLDVEVVAAQH